MRLASMRLRFGLRTFLLGVTIVSVGAGWSALRFRDRVRAHTPSLNSNTPAKQLTRILMDDSAPREDRCRAIFELFTNHVRIGSRASEFARVFPDSRWLDNTEIDRFQIIISPWAMQSAGGTTFSFEVLAEDDDSPYWIIHFILSDDFLTSADAKAFLQGRQPGMNNPQLVEFCLCFPDGREETFGTYGVCVFPAPRDRGRED